MPLTLLRTLLALALALGLGSCLRLDDNLFNNNEHPLTQYRLSQYPGDTDFKLDDSYAIPGRLVHLFTLQSRGADETAGTKI